MKAADVDSRPWLLQVPRLGLQLHPGQWLAVVGPNAAGKSTALQRMANPHAKNPDVLWLPSLPAPRMAWLPQQPQADDQMTVGELVALGRLPHQGWWGWSAAGIRQDRQDQQAIDQAMHDVDMAWAMHRRLATLSGGERQRAHLARVLATQAPVLLLDEPTAHLDAPHHRQLVQLLRRHTQRGGAVITVLHELSMALMADHVLVMQCGQMLAQGPRGSLALHRAIEQVFENTLRIVQVDAETEPLWIPVPCL